MNLKELRNKAMLLSYGIDEGIIDYHALIAWVDRILADSEKIENWMIEISLSKKNELGRIADILGKLSGYCFDGSFTELIALIAFKSDLMQIPVFDFF